jgi:predicted RNase H-like HicB family nuclease
VPKSVRSRSRGRSPTPGGTDRQRCILTISPYNLNSVKSRSRQRTDASAYRATREPPQQSAPADARDLSYPVTLVQDEDDAWVATIDALPGCNARGSTPDEAVEQVAGAVVAALEAAEREGKEVPEPKTTQSHSGRLLLRMPQSLHAELARAAERERVSLNQFITDALSGSLGWRSPDRDRDENVGDGTRAAPVGRFESRNATALSTDSRSRLPTAVFVANGIIVALAAVVAIVVLIVALR